MPPSCMTKTIYSSKNPPEDQCNAQTGYAPVHLNNHMVRPDSHMPWHSLVPQHFTRGPTFTLPNLFNTRLAWAGTNCIKDVCQPAGQKWSMTSTPISHSQGNRWWPKSLKPSGHSSLTCGKLATTTCIKMLTNFSSPTIAKWQLIYMSNDTCSDQKHKKPFTNNHKKWSSNSQL